MRQLSLAAALACALATTYAHGDCRHKLEQVDSQLESADLEGIARQQFTMIRDQAAMFCAQGQEAMAMQFLAGLEQELPAPDGSEDNHRSSNSRPAISDKYLAGTWCAIVTQEQSQITFSRNGTYSACFHDSMQGRFGHCNREQSTEQWLSGFKQARIISDNEFALGNSARSTRYKRGECSQHGI
jgi:hypothetical protein